MTSALVAGLAAGLVSAAVSEALLKWWSGKPETSAFKVALTGTLLRTAWMTAALAAGLVSRLWEPRAFTAALLGTYLIAQIVEGIRYRRFVDNR
ncbi:MAG: hypothetical protein KDC27_08680 [Acidobacteria bacterium]|nr:hypothetical protein [Acidobacteriota bacterium]